MWCQICSLTWYSLDFIGTYANQSQSHSIILLVVISKAVVAVDVSDLVVGIDTDVGPTVVVTRK